MQGTRKTVFLDRDGVINYDSPDYIKSCTEFKFLPNSLEAIRLLTLSGFNVIIITNQSAIGRKMITTQGLNDIFTKMTAGVREKGGHITDIFYCPHLPEDNCECRKPKPQMILKAQKKHNIDMRTAIMVGDSAKDIECAKSAGCSFSILVKTGNGINAAVELAKKNIRPDYVAEDLFEAAKWIIEKG